MLILCCAIVAAADIPGSDDVSVSGRNSVVQEHRQEAADLGGKRLFFDAVERENQRQKPVHDKEVKVLSQKHRTDPTLQGRLSGDVALESVGRSDKTIQFRYSARIRSSDAVVVIVDDVPCAPVDRLELAASAHGLKIDCTRPASKLPVLMLRKDEQTLWMSGVAPSAAGLLPGETR